MTVCLDIDFLAGSAYVLAEQTFALSVSQESCEKFSMISASNAMATWKDPLDSNFSVALPVVLHLCIALHISDPHAVEMSAICIQSYCSLRTA